MPIRNHSKTYKVPRRPFEKARLDHELELVGKYGLRNKREVWRVAYTLAKLRKAARTLLTLEEDDPKRRFEGRALLRKLLKLGVLTKDTCKLDYILALKIEDFMERRLQTVILKKNMASSIHQARVIIKQGHIVVGKQLVNVPSFMVRVGSESHIDFAPNSAINPLNAGVIIGRSARMKAKHKKVGGDEDEE